MISLAIPPGRGLATARALARGLLATILVACASCAAIAWWLGSPTVVGLSLVIAAEETLEISVVLAALRRGERHGISDPIFPGSRERATPKALPRAPRLFPALPRNLR